MKQAPDLYNFVDVRAYLQAWLSHQEEFNSRFSHRNFARKAKTSNPSLLLQAANGTRNITLEMVPVFLRGMGLKKEEAHYFELLVQVDLSRRQLRLSSDQPLPAGHPLLDRLQTLQRLQKAGKIQGRRFRYLSEWQLTAIRELVLCPDFQEDSNWILQQLYPKLSEAQVKEAIAILLDLDLLRRNEAGRLVATDVHVTTDDDAMNEAAVRYHHHIQQLSAESLGLMRNQEIQREDCRFLGITAAVSEDKQRKIIQELHRMHHQLLSLCAEPEEHPDRVLQIHLQMFPLSRPIIPGPD